MPLSFDCGRGTTIALRRVSGTFARPTIPAVPSWSYLDEYEEECEELLQAVDRVFRSGRLILGEEVKLFENEFANFCETSCSIGVATGTDALFLALKALGIGHEDEVITVANTAIPTVSAIVSTGAIPKFADISNDDFLIDASEIESLITTKTRCILPVHLYGQCAQMAEIMRVADQNGLVVVEDCAQAHGATLNDKKAGSMGHAGAFSFYPTKVLGAYGDAGIVTCSDQALAERIRRLRVYGANEQYYALEHGYNSRIDELHAAILRHKLNRIDVYINRRRYLANRYDQALKNTSLILPGILTERTHVYYLYTCRHPDRDALIAELAGRGINLQINYPTPIYRMPAYRHLGFSDNDLPNTARACREVFCLPLYPSLRIEQQDQVIEALLETC